MRKGRDGGKNGGNKKKTGTKKKRKDRPNANRWNAARSRQFYLLYVICYMLIAICHLLYVTCYLLLFTCSLFSDTSCMKVAVPCKTLFLLLVVVRLVFFSHLYKFYSNLQKEDWENCKFITRRGHGWFLDWSRKHLTALSNWKWKWLENGRNSTRRNGGNGL